MSPLFFCMKIIYGPRQSGRTMKLFYNVRRYLYKNSSGYAFFISPTKARSIFAEEYYKRTFDDDLIDRITFTYFDEYQRKYKKGYSMKKAHRSIFIDDFDDMLRYIFETCIDTVTMHDKDEGRIVL